ncbi:hypothetical protein LGT39_06990 [Demequina sp. TTPB684]|uniref:hypothetical protein n=1 Tax=unclassified Demequina TaxID=2620311 RepID=UPI001CF3A002|nr:MULTISPECIES: hypothetical protein [unclassified Demequina]MCB2412594.1 hypothetical protein [Demequina sp. TTPB684]UPU89539.1 hypothetical protein LGT36_006325 [Demequina sp. TMPB413]
MSSTPPRSANKPARTAANEETTVLTPVTDGTAPIDRIPVRRQRLWIAVTSLLVILLGVAGYLIYHLSDVANQWETQVEDIKAQNYDLGQRLADEQTQVIELQGQVDTVSEQLRTVQQRILELADDVAQRDDNAEFYARQITDLTGVLTTASAVANSLNKCVEYKEQLIGYLKEPDNYDPAEVEAFETGVDKVCTAATSANVDLQTVLAQ